MDPMRLGNQPRFLTPTPDHESGDVGNALTGVSVANPLVAPILAVQAGDYLVDAFQRSVLFWDTLRRRGDNALRRKEEGHPPVLHYDYQVLLDGRKSSRPVNYALLKIKPDPTVPTDARQRPFVIVDPRAGHGPGIGGFKQDSEVGMALRAGHPVYFVGFFPRPMPGQKLTDVAEAEARFIEEVARRHPDADKPCVIGNCQAGWAVAALAAVRPEIMGPLILSGAPLAYWSGVSGKNPMRYTAGLIGGQWMESLACDLGHGLFDGAYLVQNFENLNPANTLWTKYYNLYSRIDTEAERFLEFEAWWSGYFLMNAEEMDAIVSDLFVGNRLARGAITTPEGSTINLKNIRSPVVVFASRGDNITPPQQALNWIEDVYGSDRNVIESGRTIVYLLHEKVGHLGVFVSGSVAKKEYSQLVGTLEMIDALPPGLYEMIIKPAVPGRLELPLPGQYSVRFEVRKLSDIRALGDSRRDEEAFVAVDAVSRLGEAIYQSRLGPWLRTLGSDWLAECLREWHPLRVQRRILSSQNPVVVGLSGPAPLVRRFRRPVPEGNWFQAQEALVSESVIAALDLSRDMRDVFWETVFKFAYGPLGWGGIFRVQPAAQVGAPTPPEPSPTPPNGELTKGGPLAAILRMLAAVCLDRGVFDPDSAVRLRSLLAYSVFREVTPTELKALFRQQASLLRRYPEPAINALADMLLDAHTRQDAVRTVLEVLGSGSDMAKLNGPLCRRIRRVFGNELWAGSAFHQLGPSLTP
jgi:pimeloyl-ACP methyl ester carboxylesterase